MSELYVYTDDDCGTDNGPMVNVKEEEESYYGVPMRFSKIKETQFRTIMQNIGESAVIIDANKEKINDCPYESIYGDVHKQHIISNFPDSNKGYYLVEHNYNTVTSRLTDHLNRKYSKDKTNIWIPKVNGSDMECNWFIDPSDWSIRNYGNDNVLGRVTNIEIY